jgi:hypothetical protein
VLRGDTLALNLPSLFRKTNEDFQLGALVPFGLSSLLLREGWVSLAFVPTLGWGARGVSSLRLGSRLQVGRKSPFPEEGKAGPSPGPVILSAAPVARFVAGSPQPAGAGTPMPQTWNQYCPPLVTCFLRPAQTDAQNKPLAGRPPDVIRARQS